MMIFSLLVSSVLSAISVSQPINPSEYQGLIGPGFSTNWFKTYPPLSKYNDQNIQDVYDRGFRNLRLRCRADLYAAPYDHANFTDSFLNNLTAVVDKCLEVGVTPIISWIHHHAEAYASEEDRKNYVTWWTKVANTLKNRGHKLSFNLFTELGIDECGSKENCTESLRMNTTKYNRWTSDVVAAIRATGGNSANRILILGSPGKTARDLDKIDQTIYDNDSYMMAEWHMYASGPNKKEGGQKYWSGDGEPVGKENVAKAIKPATDFTNDTGILTYLGAWMPQDNAGGSLTEAEVINFARYFPAELKKKNIPWSLNVLDRYYDTENSQWLTDIQDIKGQALNMSKVLDNIRSTVNTNNDDNNKSSNSTNNSSNNSSNNSNNNSNNSSHNSLSFLLLGSLIVVFYAFILG